MTSEYTTLLNGRVKLIQSINGLRATMDSVLLASVLIANKGDKILDMGCGTGAVGLCAVTRLKDLELNLTGVDIQDEMIDIAIQNGIENNIDDRTNYITANINDKSLFNAEQFDHILMNPPYFEGDARIKSTDEARETAFNSGALNDWIGSAIHWVKQGGSLNIIHRACELDNILQIVGNRFGAIEIWPIYSKTNEPAKRVVIKMIRSRKTPLKIHQPIMLFDNDGNETPQAKSILRDGNGLV